MCKRIKIEVKMLVLTYTGKSIMLFDESHFSCRV